MDPKAAIKATLNAQLAVLSPPHREIRFDKLGVLRNDMPGLGGGAALPKRRAESRARTMASDEDRSSDAARLAHIAETAVLDARRQRTTEVGEGFIVSTIVLTDGRYETAATSPQDRKGEAPGDDGAGFIAAERFTREQDATAYHGALALRLKIWLNPWCPEAQEELREIALGRCRCRPGYVCPGCQEALAENQAEGGDR